MEPPSDADRRVHEGHWVDLWVRRFVNLRGEQREWEYCTRKQATGAVAIIAVTLGDDPRIVLVEQYRPPLGARILEFPAGLVEPGHEPEASALRELEEETGCRGRVVAIGPSVFESPGLTNASVAMVAVEVESRHAPRHEPDEDIRVVEVRLGDLADALRRRAAEGVAVDAKLWCFALGLDRCRR